MFQSTWKWYKQLEFFKKQEIVLNSNVETIDLDAPALKHHKLTDKLSEKMAVLDRSMKILNLKPEECISRLRYFQENGCCNFKTDEPLPTNYHT